MISGRRTHTQKLTVDKDTSSRRKCPDVSLPRSFSRSLENTVRHRKQRHISQMKCDTGDFSPLDIKLDIGNDCHRATIAQHYTNVYKTLFIVTRLRPCHTRAAIQISLDF